MIVSVFENEGRPERLLRRASNHRSQLEELRTAYLSEMRRPKERALPEAVRIQCHNVSLAIESAQRELAQLEGMIEEAEAVEAMQAEEVQL